MKVCNDVGCDSTTAYYEQINKVGLDIPTTASVNEPVYFGNHSNGITDMTWLYGDGALSIEYEPTHTYTLARPYTIEAYLTNSDWLDCTQRLAQDINILGDGSGISGLSCMPTVYPNPSEGLLQIGNCAPEVKAIQLVSANGTTIKVIKNPDTTFQLELQAYPSGLYLLQWIDESGSILGVNRFVLR